MSIWAEMGDSRRFVPDGGIMLCAVGTLFTHKHRQCRDRDVLCEYTYIRPARPVGGGTVCVIFLRSFLALYITWLCFVRGLLSFFFCVCI